MSYLLEALGRGLMGRLLDIFGTHLPAADADEEAALRGKQALSPTSADLSLRLGTLLLRQVRLNEAQALFRQALELLDHPRLAAIGLACVHDELAQFDEAIRCLAIAAADDPTDPAVAFAIGYCYERQGDAVAAAANYRHAIELHPYLRNAYERLGAIAVRAGDWPGAVEQYAVLADVEPGDLDVLLTRATAHLNNNEPELAEEQYQRALLVEPESEGPLSEAERLSADGRLDEAIDAVRRLVDKFPGVPDFHVHLGDLYAQAGQDSDAIAEYRRALEYHPGFLEATIKLGTQQLRRGEYVDAAQSFARAVELNDRLILAFVGLGVAQHAQGRDAEAHATFDLAASLEPNSTLLFSETNRLQFKSELRGGGEPAENVGPQTATDAETDSTAQMLSLAIQRHEQALLHRPNHADLHYRHGLLLRQAGKPEQAIGAFQNALRINPHYAKALVKLGVCFKELGRVDEAVTTFTRAVTLGMDYVDIHYQLGLLFAQRSRFDLAVEEFDQAATGNVRNMSIKANLALALQNLGMLDRAQATWRSVCEMARGADRQLDQRESALRTWQDQ